MRSVMVGALALALVGCGGADESTGGDDAAAQVDLAHEYDFALTPRDLALLIDASVPPDFSGIGCGAQTCTADQVCCAAGSGAGATYTCADSCPDGGLTIACDGPDNCRSGSANFCCGRLFPSGGTAPLCDVSVTSACADTCTTQLPQSCSGDPGVVRLCHRVSDCAGDAAHASCCQFASSGTNITFCADDALKSVAAVCFD
jgi:hypothetical protein